MNIVIFALGSQGDVQPYIALGVGLQRTGHSVRIATHENYERAVLAHDLEFHAMHGDVQALVESEEMRRLLERGNFLEITRRTTLESQRASVQWAKDGLGACQGADLLVAGVGGLFLALAFAEKLELPLLRAFVFPFTPTTAFPGALFPKSLGKLGGAVNRLSHEALRQIMWQGSRGGDTLARKQVLGLPPAPFFGPYASERLNRFPALYGFSPSVIPQPEDWKDARVTGYWFLDASSDWTPPPALEAFLQSGPPPVFVGFGSMGSRDPEKTAALVLEALERTGQRAILQSGWGGLRADSLPEHVHVTGSVPHAWLFPRVAAVVHHGGAGTTAAGLRAGVPSVIVPFFGDQPFWGERVHTLGVGPAPIPRKQLTVERLARAIQDAVSNLELRERAAALGAKIQAEDGIGNAVRLLEEIRPLVLEGRSGRRQGAPSTT
jgi:sterol 3beta-glucosyltransferase